MALCGLPLMVGSINMMVIPLLFTRMMKVTVLVLETTTATYTNLDPGTYTFWVKASNNDGIWNDEAISLTIEVRPPWWATVWFRLLVIAVIAAAVFRFISYKTKQLKKNQRILELKVKEATDKVNAQNSKLREAQGKLTSIMDDVKNQLGKASEEL